MYWKLMRNITNTNNFIITQPNNKMINPKTITETIGTALLVFTIQASGSDLAPLAIGAILISQEALSLELITILPSLLQLLCAGIWSLLKGLRI
jgi:glycerol uptake facilitator-like aquaporin